MKTFLGGLLVLAAVSFLWSGPAGPRLEAQAKDPAIGGHFIELEIDGAVQPPIRGVEGLLVETQVLEFREGGDPNTVHKSPGPSKFGDVVIRVDPQPLGTTFWTWYSGILKGTPAKKKVSLVLKTKDGAVIVRYDLFNAWPSKFETARQVSLNTAVPVEAVTITYEVLDRTVQG